MEVTSFRRWRRPTIFVAFVAIVTALVWKAWVAEDSYIGFRMLDNLVHGYGLRWNIYERVNAITNPLWIFLNLPLYVISGNVFFATFVTGTVLVLATWALLFRRMPLDWDVVAGGILVPLLLSKSYTDFMVSGLETSLSVFLVAAFAVEYFSESSSPAAGRLTRLALIAALGGLSRPDLPVFFVLPLAAFILKNRIPVKRVAAAGLVGGSPFVGWLGFCFFYYGFPLPNTYYMRLATGIPASDYFKQGLLYVLDLVRRDPVSTLLLGIGFAGGLLLLGAALSKPVAASLAESGFRGGATLMLGWSAGIALLTIYVLRVGGDFMAGRFFLIPVFASSLLIGRIAIQFFGDAPESRRIRTVIGLAVIAAIVFILPRPQLPPGFDETGVTDEKEFYSQTNDLLSLTWTNGPSKHIWSVRGLQDRDRARTAGDSLAVAYCVGMRGYYGGPRVALLDGFGHTDAFLARLPVTGIWRIGHFQRAVPAGYFESTLERRVVPGFDPLLKEFYEKLRFVISGPVFSWDRIRTAIDLNRGKYRPAIEAYRKRVMASQPKSPLVPPGFHPPPS